MGLQSVRNASFSLMIWTCQRKKHMVLSPLLNLFDNILITRDGMIVKTYSIWDWKIWLFWLLWVPLEEDVLSLLIVLLGISICLLILSCRAISLIVSLLRFWHSILGNSLSQSGISIHIWVRLACRFLIMLRRSFCLLHLNHIILSI